MPLFLAAALVFAALAITGLAVSQTGGAGGYVLAVPAAANHAMSWWPFVLLVALVAAWAVWRKLRR